MVYVLVLIFVGAIFIGGFLSNKKVKLKDWNKYRS